jgi:tetratricopeptide (TPR) repeat protein
VEAAEAVCGDPEGRRQKAEGGRRATGGSGDDTESLLPSAFCLLPSDPLDYLAHLREASLVLAEESAGGMRFRMLDTLREYAAEQLAPEERDALARRHAEYHLALAVRAQPQFERGPDQAIGLARLDAELDNLRAALDWAEVTRNVDLWVRLGSALAFFWDTRGYLAEGRERLDRLLALPEAALAVRVQALAAAGWLAMDQGDYAAARTYWEETLAIHRNLGDQSEIARSCNALGNVARHQGDYTAARPLHEESLAICRSIDLPDPGKRLLSAVSLDNLAELARCQGDYKQAQVLYEEVMEIKRSIGYQRGLALTLNWLGRVLRNQREYAAARAMLEESRKIGTEIGDLVSVHWAMNNLGHVMRGLGDFGRARALHAESLALSREMGDRLGIAECLEGWAELALAQEQPARGARLFGAAAALRKTLGTPLPPSDRVAYDQQIAALSETLGEAAFTDAWEAGRALAWRQAADYALEASS